MSQSTVRPAVSVQSVLMSSGGHSGGDGPSSVVLDVEDSEAAGHQAAVLWLQTVGDALLHLLTASQEPAAVPGQLLPGAPPVLLLLATAGEELLHVVTETNLMGRRRVRTGSVLLG